MIKKHWLPTKLSKKSKPVNSLPPEYATGIDLLQALEPMMMEHIQYANNKKYALWVLTCLRRELANQEKKTLYSSDVIFPWNSLNKDENI